MPDRAAIAATAVMAIIHAQLQRGKAADFTAMRAEIEAALRDELADVARHVRGERDRIDD